MKQNENILPLLPRGITGFWSGGEEPRPRGFPGEFKRLAYAIARSNQMIVSHNVSPDGWPVIALLPPALFPASIQKEIFSIVSHGDRKRPPTNL